jgi:hypothetical protein
MKTTFLYSFYVSFAMIICLTATAEEPSKVDFSYAFATPHRIAVGMPEAVSRTLLDLQPEFLKIMWTYDDLTTTPLASFLAPRTRFGVNIKPYMDGRVFQKTHWIRPEDYLPGVINTYEDSNVTLTLSAFGAEEAMMIKIDMVNNGDSVRRIRINYDAPSITRESIPMENMGWADPDLWDTDILVAGWQDRADRICLLGIGAEQYSTTPDRRPPGLSSMVMCWTLKPGEKKSGWAIRPYNKVVKDAEELRRCDWNVAWAAAKKTWQTLLFDRTAKFNIPDEKVRNAFLASFADLFIMREPIAGGYIGSVPGTEAYRAVNSCEAAIVAIALDQLGLPHHALEGYKVSYELQSEAGDWNDPIGWGHLGWANAGFKSWAAIEHYRLTGSKAFLEWIYPRMLSNARWTEKMRAYSRKPYQGEKPVNYGLMPRGMGDGGLMNDKDYYGIFIPHNIWSVYASLIAADVAKILGKTEEYGELKTYFDTAYSDLLATIEKGAITADDGSRWIPGVANLTSGSIWAALNIATPCGLLPATDKLIDGTLHHLEAKSSPGGLPMHTGWLVEGMWVAITLDNIGAVHLSRRNGDPVANYFYATLNHGTPLYTWCEERGPEPNTTVRTGDRQHLWTPVAIVRALRDMMVLEQYPAVNEQKAVKSSLQLALGSDRSWLGSGNAIGVENAPTHFGNISYSIRYDAATKTVHGAIQLAEGGNWPKPDELVLNVRLPDGRKVSSVKSAFRATVQTNGEAIRWTNAKGKFDFVAKTKE